MGVLSIVAILRSKPGQEARLRTDLTALVGPSRDEEGNLRYELYADQADSRQFILVEEWADEASREKHHTTGPHIQHFHANGVVAVERSDVYKLDRIA